MIDNYIIKRISFFCFIFLIVSCIPRESKGDSGITTKSEDKPVVGNYDFNLSDKALNKADADATLSSDALKLITWNIQNLGQSKDSTEIAFIVNILKDFDIVAIQEVVAKHPAGAQKVAQIADELNRKGSKWDYRISDPTKSPSVYMSERYAFLWKTSKVDLKGRAYLDDELASVIFREPYIAKFKMKNSDSTFHVINFHSRKYNDNPELETQYFKYYQERLSADKLLIAGDFNLNEKHEVWNDLYEQGFKSALKDQKTTLKQKCSMGDYLSHEIDNIYYSKGMTFQKSGVVDFVQHCENLILSRMISDHLPVFLEFTIKGN
ncbi:endonuclease/exonuclease/phosphatase family protein [Winogradskyella thalassocola]|uniref:Endonuclease/Exonuclease/phosphatase family protein n=1 Tax=Winogradskyella thalassocola TaxID=262004 RepID=A0A1G8B987_9FLAO|nr:endonuclease/exonuclease/phosphatase family protein [Winogradskyella thalassocola]SDH29809.1 Endonuclease/Exonuclease/phosphatase family protein [Winogradskyella thalassocola]